MTQIKFILLSFTFWVSCLGIHDGKYEGALISLFEYLHIKRCLILEDFKLSDMRTHVKHFSRIGIATGLINFEAFSKIAKSSVGTYSNTAVLLDINDNEGQIEQLLKYQSLFTDVSFTWMARAAPGIKLLDWINVPVYCQFLILERIDEATININEFYSIGDLRKESRWGSWSTDTELSVDVKESLFRRRRDFNGTSLVAAYSFDEANSYLQWWFWDLVQDFYNFKTDKVKTTVLQKHGRGGQGLLMNTPIDAETYSRDAVWPLGSADHHLMFKRSTEDNSFWMSYFQPFTYQAWTVVLPFVLLIWVLVPLLKITVLKTGTQSTEEKFDPVGYGCLTFDTLMGQSGMEVPTMMLSFRIAFFVTVCFSALLQCLYGGELISYLTTHLYPIPFSDLSGLVKDGTYNVTFRPKTHTEELLLENFGPAVGDYVRNHYTQFSDYDKLPQQLCNERVVYAGEPNVVHSRSKEWPCEIVQTARSFDKVHAALYTTPNFASAFKLVLPLLHESGLSKRERLVYYHKPLYDPGISDLTEVDLPRVAPALALLCCGVALAVLVLLLEMWVLRCLSPTSKNSPRVFAIRSSRFNGRVFLHVQ